MNTDVAVEIIVEPRRQAEAMAAAHGLEAWFEHVEATLSRFRPDSELSRLNRSSGERFEASPMLLEVLGAAVEAARTTNGLFDPTILPALLAAGYDRSFELLGETQSPRRIVERQAAFSWRDIVLDEKRGTIQVPAGCGLDLGGIGKGWTVDRSAERLAAFNGFAIDAGGDLCVRGTQADGQPWTVGVQNPFAADSNLLVLAVRDAAVATSTIARRQWIRDGRTQHHLIDPRTASPAATGVIAVTVLSRSVARSEVLAKAALILGPVDGQAFLAGQPEAEGLLVLGDGRVLASSPAFGSVPETP